MKQQDSLSTYVPCKHTKSTAAQSSNYLLTMQMSKKLIRHSESRVTTHCSLATEAPVPVLHRPPQPNTDWAQPEAGTPKHARHLLGTGLLVFTVCSGSLSALEPCSCSSSESSRFHFSLWSKAKQNFFFFFLKEFLKIVSLEESDKTHFKQKSKTRQNMYILDIMLTD